MWIEVAYLYRASWKEERQWDDVCSWLWAEARHREIAPWRIEPHLDLGRDSKVSAAPMLPRQHEKNEFLRRPEIVEFFQAIRANPDQLRTCAVSGYSMTVHYSPDAEGPFVSSRRPVLDAAKTIKEHHVYKVLKAKAEQHKVAGPRVICVGSDQIPALLSRQSPGGPALSDAVEAVFAKHTSLSAAMIFCLDNIERPGRGLVFCNPRAREPLTEEEVALLCTMNLNRWSYTFALPQWKQPHNEGRRRATGKVSWQMGAEYMEIKVPASLVVDALAGKTSLPEELQLSERDELRKRLETGWVIEACSMEEGNLEAGEDRKVVLRLVPPPECVFWPRKKGEDKAT